MRGLLGDAKTLHVLTLADKKDLIGARTTDIALPPIVATCCSASPVVNTATETESSCHDDRCDGRAAGYHILMPPFRFGESERTAACLT